MRAIVISCVLMLAFSASAQQQTGIEFPSNDDDTNTANVYAFKFVDVDDNGLPYYGTADMRIFLIGIALFLAQIITASMGLAATITGGDITGGSLNTSTGYVVLSDSTTNSEFYNSSEPGCRETTETVTAGILRCDDFEDGDASPNDCNNAAAEDDGWCRNVFYPANCSSDPSLCDDPTGHDNGWGRCGGLGAAGSDCAYTRGILTGDGAGAMGDVDFTADAGFDELYIRWYQKWNSGFTWPNAGGNEKILTINECCRGGGGIAFGGAFMFSTDWETTATNTTGSAIQVLIPEEDANRGSNIDSTTTSSGVWYAIEVHVILNSANDVADGTLEIWRDNCGADGLGCTGSQTLVMQHTDVEWTGTTFLPSTNFPDNFGAVWFEEWSNGGGAGSIGETLIDQIIISENPIGWSTYGLP